VSGGNDSGVVSTHREQLAFEVEHVVGALGQSRVGAGAQRVGLRTDRGAPRMAGALAAGDAAARRIVEHGIVEHRRMRLDDRALGTGCAARALRESGRERRDGRIEAGLLDGDAFALLWDDDVGGTEPACPADRQAGRRGDAGQRAGDCGASRHGGNRRADRGLGGLVHAALDQVADRGERGGGIGASGRHGDGVVVADRQREQGDRAADIGGLVAGCERDVGGEALGGCG